MAPIIRATLAILVFASGAQAATLTITPDKSTYSVGETITLSVFGDAEGAADNGIFGRILFDPGLAEYVSSSQQALTSFSGGITWNVGVLSHGADFADAFGQVVLNPQVPDGPLFASVTLLALDAGTLEHSWQTTGGNQELDFFGITNAPGGSVTIIPEPEPVLLLSLGLLGLALARTDRINT